MPDIDLDYPDDRRHELIEYTIHKYGSDKVAQIITFGTMGARGAIRDVGRALDVPLNEVDGIARLIPAVSGKPVTIKDVLTYEHEFFSPELFRRYEEDIQVRTLIDTAQSLEGVSRHASTHAAGVIISDIPLVGYTPLHRPTSGGGNDEGIGVVTQWPMEVLDSIGLLKVDFLGLSTLTILRAAADLIEERYGIKYTIDNIPYRLDHVGPDPEKKPEALFEMLGRGDVAGVFQVESTGMRRLMTTMKPKRFEHIMAAISLFRPGPMENIPAYIERMHGKTPVTYHHEDLESILSETYGILVYQEQIIKIASEFAGYAPGEADKIRKAVAKKKRDLMDKHKAQFFAGAMERGYDEEVCDKIWSDIEFFARYGFNKAHAADYAVITCQTAFLKAHYPVEYMTALLSVEKNDTDKVAQYLAESKRLNIGVAPPHINCSSLDFSIEGELPELTIRYGLGAIKNAGAAAIELILEERDQNGHFSDLADLCERVDLRRVGKRALESMVKVGVFDDWGKRPQLLESLDRVMAYSGKTHDAAAAGQMSLFGSAAGPSSLDVELLREELEFPEPDQREILQWEKELVGVYISRHPLEEYQDIALELGCSATTELQDAAYDQGVSLLGMLTKLRKYTAKNGREMAFGTIEDMQGSVDLVFFPSTWAALQSNAELDKIYLVRGKVRANNGEQASVVVNSMENNLEVAREMQITPVNVAEKAPASNKTIRPRKNSQGKSGKQMQSTKSRASQATTLAAAKRVSQVNAASPPPPPNFDDTALQQLEPVEKEAVSHVADDPFEEDPAVEAEPTLPSRRSIVVEIKAAQSWRDTCREIVSAASSFEGRDSLEINVKGRSLVMAFPNQNTDYCPELNEALRKLPDVLEIEVA
jgi:DNA polymerase-3 subunit alpha